MIRKPMLALNYDEGKLRFPLGVQPKIDGVRGLNMNGALTARSLKPHGNAYTRDFYSGFEFVGLDGELAAGHETDKALCRTTTSAVSTHEGEPFTLWHVFDYVTPETYHRTYATRYNLLVARVHNLQQQFTKCGHLRVVPMTICDTLEQVLRCDEENLDLGYEGTIIRGLASPHKEGKSTIREGGLLRIKRFIQEEAIVKSIVEGNHNGNIAQINELGKTFRTSHQENKVPNGRVGSMICEIIKDSELFKKGQIITVSKGEMTDDLAKYYFEHPEELLEQIIKFNHFPKGVKDKPRFPTWASMRSKEDM